MKCSFGGRESRFKKKGRIDAIINFSISLEMSMDDDDGRSLDKVTVQNHSE